MTRAGLSKRSEGLVSHKKSPHQSQDRKKMENKRGWMETNSNNNNNRKEGKLETWVWLVSQHPMAAAVQHGRVESLSVWMWMSDCAAIGFPLSFCTGTEEIAGWEKVTWPNESSPHCPPTPKVSQHHLSAFSLQFSAFLIQYLSAAFIPLYKVWIAQRLFLSICSYERENVFILPHSLVNFQILGGFFWVCTLFSTLFPGFLGR